MLRCVVVVYIYALKVRSTGTAVPQSAAIMNLDNNTQAA